MSLDIVDAQLHEFGPRGEYSVEDPGMRHTIMLESTLASMDAVGVSAALLHPIDPGIARLAAGFPDRLRLVVHVDPTSQLLEEEMAALAERPEVVGVRLVVAIPPVEENVSALEAGAFESFLSQAERYELPVFVYITGFIRAIGSSARAHPGLQFVIDHMGLPQPPLEPINEPPFEALDELLELSACPNVAVKLSGVPGLSQAPFPYQDVWPHLHRLMDGFGVKRLMWGSDINRFQGYVGWDWPMPDRVYGQYLGKHTYAESLALFLETTELSASEKAQLLGGTVRELVRWPEVQESA